MTNVQSVSRIKRPDRGVILTAVILVLIYALAGSHLATSFQKFIHKSFQVLFGSVLCLTATIRRTVTPSAIT